MYLFLLYRNSYIRSIITEAIIEEDELSDTDGSANAKAKICGGAA